MGRKAAKKDNVIESKPTAKKSEYIFATSICYDGVIYNKGKPVPEKLLSIKKLQQYFTKV